MNADSACPCGSGKTYVACCGPYLDHGQRPATAETLMRSRYSGYVLAREGYLRRSWHESTRPETLDLSGKAGTVNWLGLKIVRVEAGGSDDTRGVVEFVARYKVGGKAHRLHETSRFVREEGQWFYLDGTPHARECSNLRRG
ncbi:MAG: SEC-C domain-containing protein [Candidatus Competibacteraceae bacterium]|nr:MAG: SEC-C domain-containing protein [Candidatus Competibacteraceae bacterium]